MIRPLRLLGLMLLTAGITTAAFAVPAPLSEQELTDKSDLVALVRVLSVTCTTITKDAQTGEDLPGYLAKRSNGATYASTWLNAKSEIVTSPETKELPTVPGETVVPPQEPKPQTPL